MAVDSASAANSGAADDGLFSVKGGLNYAFTLRLTAYLNAGTGFHSNDACGATIRIDPVSGEPTEPAEGVEDIHFHPLEPRTVRISVAYSY